MHQARATKPKFAPDSSPEIELHEKIGQLLLFGWNGGSEDERLDAGPHAIALVDDLAVGGVIIMGRNVAGRERLGRTTGSLQARNSSFGRPPLFVAVDQEGGRVQRLGPPDFTAIPPARDIGASGDPHVARSWASVIASELKSCGINWNFAPVLDVDNNPGNPVIGNRSYSHDHATVAAMGVSAVQGFQIDCGILACGKHFPGHGDTDIDSHHALPRIPQDQSRLNEVELVPFRAAIAAGIAAIMTAHIVFPVLDPSLPATLSPTILSGLLRNELGFTGLIITDDLEMRGVADGWGAAEASVLSVIAGADVLLCCHTLATQFAIRDALVQAVQSGRIPMSRINDASARIAAAKTSLIATTAI